MKKKLKNIVLGLGSIGVVVAPIASTVSCSLVPNHFDHRIINQYGELSASVLQTQRAFDNNFTSGNKFSLNKLENASTVLPLIRDHVTGKDVPTYTRSKAKGSYDYTVGFSQTQKKDLQFEGAKDADVVLQTGPTTPIKIADANHIPAALAGSAKWKSITFNMRDNVHYVNYKNQETPYKLVGRDYLYGLIRTLYAGTELRDRGLVNGQRYKQLPKFSTNDSNLLKANDDKGILGMNNPNSYLFDLFGVDLEKTIADNLSLPADSSKFIIDFDANGGQAGSIVGFFANSATFSPSPSEKIDELAQQWVTNPGGDLSQNPGIKYGISNYGYNKMQGINLNGYKDFLSVAPYIYTKYDTMSEFVIEQNKHYAIPGWSSDPHTIRKVVYHILPSGGDANAQILQRISDYNKGIESILDKKVYASPQFEQFKQDPKKSGYTYQKLVEAGISNFFGWDISANPADIKYKGAEGYNGKGYEMMYGNGVDSSDKVLNGDFAAIDGFMNGNGSVLRDIMNNAINAYTMVQESTTASNQTDIRSILKPETHLWSYDENNLSQQLSINKPEAGPNADPNFIFSRSSGAPTEKELSDYYNANSGNIAQAFKSPYFSTLPTASAKNLPAGTKSYSQKLKDLAAKVGVSTASPAQVPIQFFEASDQRLTPQLNKTYDSIVATLNALDPGVVKFVRADKASTLNTFTLAVQTGRGSMFHHTSWGTDYPLASSNYQGLFSSVMGVGAIMGALYHDFITDPSKPYLPKLDNIIKSNPKDSKGNPEYPVLNMPKDSLKAVFNKINVKDLRESILEPTKAATDLDKNTNDLLAEFESVISKPFYEISEDQQAVRNLTSYYMDHSFIYPYVTASASMPNATSTKRANGVAAAEIVKKPWLTTATSPTGAYLLIDYRVDE